MIHSARSDDFHSLTVRLDPAATVNSVHERACAIDGLSWWHERISAACDEPAARARARAEADRPLHLTARGPRALYLEYAKGPADLVLVARRSELSGPDLRALALALAQGQRFSRQRATSSTGHACPAPDMGAAADEERLPEWGIGDPAAGGRCGEASIPIPPGASATDTVLLAAAVITLARYSSLSRFAVAAWWTELAEADASIYEIDYVESEIVGDHLARYRNPLSDARSPQIGVVLDQEHPGEWYRPFLAPPLAVMVHWQRAADGTVSGLLGYRERDVAPEIACEFAAHLGHVAAQLASEPTLPLGEIELITSSQDILPLTGGLAPSAADASSQTIHGLLAEVTVRQPDTVALVDDMVELTYAELEQRAARLARGLYVLGATPGSIVAVALDRTADLVVVLLAVLKAGCAYLPVDIRYPVDRLRYTVEHAGATIVVGQPESFPHLDGVRVAKPDELAELADRAPTASQPAVKGSDLAYVIYTSGSTGRPKGVAVPHRNVAALVSATQADFSFDGYDTWTFFHSCAFDFSVWEIWGCLLTGGRLVVVPYWVSRDTELFYKLVEQRQVTVLNQTPSAFAQFAEVDARLRARLALRLVVFGGEALDVGMLTSWFARHSPTNCRMSNMFGITETTVHVTEQTLTPAEIAVGSQSVGRALPGWSVSVRDPRGRVLPIGVAGEIYVGGLGVARGYLHQPALTDERFVTDPYNGYRLYRSGDLGRIRPDGRLDHLGRIDDQVKIRGHRIELGEIRNVLLVHPSVAAATVLLRHGSPGDRDTARIDAYYVVHERSQLSAADLLRHAAKMLPDYMRPTTLTRLNAIPLTANGKVDPAALPEPALAAASPAHAAPADPADPIATRLLALWSRLLNTEVCPSDNFFEMGGNSLLVVRLLRELPDHGLPRVTMQDFYRHSDAARFIELVRASCG